MSKHAVVIVVFDEISKPEFLRRLDWSYLVKAWSKAIRWETISKTSIKLHLAGIDGLDSVTVSRRTINGKVYIGARDGNGDLLQSGLWDYEDHGNLAVCYRRIHKPELASVLKDRLADFCCSTFLKEA
ncbi:MAG: hypothetical protein AB8B71_00060 [Paracoccaceae bacterium]